MNFRRIRLLAGMVFVLAVLFVFYTSNGVLAKGKQDDTLYTLSSYKTNTGGVESKSIKAIKPVKEKQEASTDNISSTKVNSASIARYSGDYGYSTLSEKGKKVYQSLYKIGLSFHNGKKNAQTVYYSDGGYGYVTGEADISSYNIYEKDINKILFAFEADYPMLYWMKGISYFKIGNKVTSVFLTVNPSYYKASTREKLQKSINKGLKSYLDQIDALRAKGSSDMYIELVVHDMLIAKCSYALDSDGEPHSAAWAHNIYGIFGKNTAVCQGYAKAFQLLMNYAGIESIYAIGDGGGEGHAWNLVKLDGVWYGVDTTWNDIGDLQPIYKTGVMYHYFNSSTSVFNKTHKYDYVKYNEMYKVPNVTSTDTYWYYSYYKLKQKNADTADYADVEKAFRDALGKIEKTSQYMLRFAVDSKTVSKSGFYQSLIKNRTALAKKLNTNGKLYTIGTPIISQVSEKYNDMAPYNFIYVPVSVMVASNIRDNVTYLDRYQYQVHQIDSNGKKDITNKVTSSTQSGKLVISYNGAEIGRYSATAKGVQVGTIPSVTYTGKAHTPKPQVKVDNTILIEGKDYTLSYKNNINAGTGSIIITGKGTYLGKKTVPFIITPQSLAGAKIAPVATMTYTGSGIKPSVSVTTAQGVKIPASNYTISGKNNVNVGTATVILTGKNNYSGTISTSFKIKKRKISLCTIAAISNQSYTGKSIKPSLKIKSGSKTLVQNVDYKVKYSNNKKPGKAKVVITGIGANLTGTKTVYFKIVPKQVKTITASSSSRKVVVKWSKASYASGYKVYYSTSKNGTYKSWGTTTKRSITKTKLKKGKVYYVKVRPYKIVDGKKQYGKYSKVVRIVVK